jgi:hypothetical protein
MNRVEITGDIRDLLVAPTQAPVQGPAAHLLLEARPIPGEFLLPSVNLRGVAGNAVHTVEKLAA